MTSPEVLGRALAAAPDPEMARVALSRVGEDARARDLLSDPSALEPAVRLLGFSSAAADLLVAHPEEAAAFGDLRPRSRGELTEELAADAATHGAAAGLRRFRRRASLRLAARDLGGARFEGVAAELTAVAEACLDLAVEEVGAEGLDVLGLGKLGGRELNYASDVDVIFVHEGTAQEDAARAAAAVASLLSEPTADGVALRVDADLRPEGRSGPLSRSREATERYYREQAATWEKQALIKARALRPDGPAASLLEDLEEVIYPAHLEVEAIEDVRSMKVRLEEYVRARGKAGVEVKRGRGGIRDIEFAVQLLQIVHGRRDPALRSTGTLPALEALADRGYVALADAAALADAYRFLRTLEHRLQIARDTQTHELPADEPSLRRLARSLGLAGPAELRAVYAERTEVVRGLHERLFYRPLLEAFAGPRVPRPADERAATEELLGALGFRDAATAFDRFDRLMDASIRTGKVLEHVFPIIAPALALAPDPDAGLVRLERAVDGLGDLGADAIASDPEIGRRLALLVGWSPWCGDLLAGHPEAIQVLAGEDDPAHAPTDRLLSAAASYVAGDLAVPAAGRRLAAIADAIVGRALEDAAPRVPFGVAGLGTLGGEELTFASDLDVVFVYEGEGAEAFEEAVRVAEAVLAGVRAAGWEADPDLRPEGKNGPLARSMAAWLEYWQRWGETWEFQSLLKVRGVAGDEGLLRRFLGAAEDFAYPDVLSHDRVAEIRRMRVRMERERVKPAEAARFHLKLGYGGLADITFAVELSQMRYGREHPAVRRRQTLDAIEALAAERLVEDSVALALGEAFVFLSQVKNALELDRRAVAEAVPPAPEAQRSLARRLGYEEHARQSFLEAYRRATRRARRAMERVFYGEEA